MEYLKNFIKGIAVGVATLVPGVSGGTTAIILGIYDDLIHAVGSFFENWKKHIVFLMQVGFGGLLGVLLFSRLLESAVNNYPYVMRYLFMGVIIGGLPVLYKKSQTIGKRRKSDYVFFAIGFLIVILMSMEFSNTTEVVTQPGFASLFFLFISGIILAIAFVLPGISGSFMLLVMGLHTLTLNAINTLNIPFLISLALGVILGTLSTAKIIEKLLDKHPGKTYMFIIGLVIGSILSVFPGIPPVNQIISSLVAMILGFAILLVLGRKGIVD